MKMTSEDLTAHIKGIVAPMLKDISGPAVAELVEAQMRKVAEQRDAEPAWMAKLMDGITGGKAKHEKPTRDNGLGLARIARAMACSSLDKTGFDGTLKQLTAWGDKDLAECLAESRTKALAAGSGPSGGYLVPVQQSAEIIQLRRAATVVRSSGVPEIPLPNGTIQVPKIASGATGSYIGENTNITKSEQVFGNVQLTAKKLACITPVSNDLVRNASAQADAIVRNDLVRSLAVTEDQAFLRSDGNNGSPKGLKYLALPANQLTTAGANSLTTITADLGSLILALMNNNTLPGKWTWVMAPRSWKALMIVQTTTGAFAFREEMAGGTLFGFPFKVTTQIPITLAGLSGTANKSEVYLFSADDQLIGDNLNLSIDVSTEAAYHDGSAVVAAFSRDQTVIRAIAEHDFATRYPESIAVMTDVVWA